MSRQSRNGRCVTIPHAPFPPTATVTAEGRKLMVLLRHPMPLVRAAGEQGYELGKDNPYQDENGPLWINWQAGYRDARQRSS